MAEDELLESAGGTGPPFADARPAAFDAEAAIDSALAALAAAALAEWPDWFDIGEHPGPSPLEKVFAFDAHATDIFRVIHRAARVPDSDPGWLKAAVTLGIFRGKTPYFPDAPAEIQARQLPLVLARKYRALRLLPPPDASAAPGALLSFAKGCEWLAAETRLRVLALVPDTLKDRPELAAILYRPHALPGPGKPLRLPCLADQPANISRGFKLSGGKPADGESADRSKMGGSIPGGRPTDAGNPEDGGPAGGIQADAGRSTGGKGTGGRPTFAGRLADGKRTDGAATKGTVRVYPEKPPSDVWTPGPAGIPGDGAFGGRIVLPPPNTGSFGGRLAAPFPGRAGAAPEEHATATGPSPAVTRDPDASNVADPARGRKADSGPAGGPAEIPTGPTGEVPPAEAPRDADGLAGPDHPYGGAFRPFWDIEGRPNPLSPGEAMVSERLSRAPDLAGLFVFNVAVETVGGDRFIVDLLWEEGRLVIEIDGYTHHSTRQSFVNDRERDFRLMLSGYRVVRIPHGEAYWSADEAVDKIRRAVEYVRGTTG
jgi:very-short-patch-repair endonuclease